MRRFLCESLLLSAACAALFAGCQANGASSTTSPGTVQAEDVGDTPTQKAPDDREVTTLAREWHAAAITEVVLDAGATAALTLDASGSVRLWPDLRTSTAPFVVAAHEPSSMSLARAGKDAFLATFVDTAGAGTVVRMEIGDGGGRQLARFEVPASDPLFEMHALEGGERIVALGVDHRVRLYDTDGTALSVLDEPGFIPYQLRVVQPTDQPAAIVAVLVKPVRVQALALADDHLAIGGDAHQVGLDQGPNRNDLALATDGASVMAMRRPKGKTREWWLERIELATGKRHKIAGESDGFARPRVHLVDAGHALLEAGTGKGQWIDLAKAVEVPIGTPAPAVPDAVSVVDLPQSTIQSRMHALVVEGTRVLPSQRSLVVDPLVGDHVVLGRAPQAAATFALDEHGARVAWAEGAELFVATTDGGAIEHRLPGPAKTVALAFLADDRLLVVAADGEASVRAIADGSIVTRVAVFSRTVDGAHFDRAKQLLAVRPEHQGVAMRVLEVKDGALGEPHDLAKAERGEWSELERLGWYTGQKRAKKLALRLRAGHVHQLIANESGTRIAVVQNQPNGNLRPDDRSFVSLHDAATGERLWTRPIVGEQILDEFDGELLFTDPFPPTWADDGERLAFVDASGLVVIDATTGAALARPF